MKKVFQVKLNDTSFLELGEKNREQDFAKMLKHLPRPLVLYAKSYIYPGAKASTNGFTCSKSFSCKDGAEDLVWIFRDGANLFRTRPQVYSNDFNIEAHELAHNLGDMAHVDSEIPHILTNRGYNNSIPQGLCEKFRRSELLLRRF